MLRRFFGNPKKRRPGQLIKEVTLKNKEVSYRLSLEKFDFDEEKIPLQDYYEALKTIKPVRDRYFILGIFSYSLLALVYFGGIKSIESYGVALESNLFLAASLLLTSIVGILFTNHQNKIYRYDSVFTYIFEKSDHSKRHDLLLRFPEAYNVMQYNPFIVGNPAHTLIKKNYPIRFIILMISVLFVAIVYLFLWSSLLYATAIELWNNSPEKWKLINRSILISSFVLYGVSWLLHNSNSGKTRYEHFGLVNLLAKLREKNPQKHQLRVQQINEILKKQNLDG